MTIYLIFLYFPLLTLLSFSLPHAPIIVLLNMKNGKYAATNGIKNKSLRNCLSTILNMLNTKKVTTATKKATVSIIFEENALILIATTTDKQTN
jgi:hypothetical protein